MSELTDYGLVRRSSCACGGVLIVASNASDERFIRAVAIHASSRLHRAYYGANTVTYNLPETSSTPVVGALRSGLTTRGVVRSAIAGRVGGPSPVLTSPSPRGEVSISPDGYDFEVRK